MLILVKVSLQKLGILRNRYLNSLPEFQELYLELMIENSTFYNILDSNKTVGYVIINSENVLIEFYLKDKYIHNNSKYFKSLINQLSIKSIYCKSFDHLLLNSCLIQEFSYSLIGVLFRDFYKPKLLIQKNISVRLAAKSDFVLLLNQKDGIDELFETSEQLDTFIKNKNIFMFFKQDRFVGCGTKIRTHKDWEYFDIGVWVHLSHRKQGVAQHIVTYLKEFSINNYEIPTCGCAIENIPSQKTLEKSGFISKHKLIKFRVNNK